MPLWIVPSSSVTGTTSSYGYVLCMHAQTTLSDPRLPSLGWVLNLIEAHQISVKVHYTYHTSGSFVYWLIMKSNREIPIRKPLSQFPQPTHYKIQYAIWDLWKKTHQSFPSTLVRFSSKDIVRNAVSIRGKIFMSAVLIPRMRHTSAISDRLMTSCSSSLTSRSFYYGLRCFLNEIRDFISIMCELIV